MKREPLDARLSAALPETVDLRLVVTDMDGTLVDGEGRLPAGLDDAVAEMRERGVLFSPASGRQMANLRAVLGPAVDDSPLIAENGSLVIHDGAEIHSVTISPDEARAAITAVHRLRSEGRDLGAVVACKESAYTERDDAPFTDRIGIYYTAHQGVDALLALPLDTVLKVAVFDFDDVEDGTAEAMRQAVPTVQTVVSGKHWVDLMSHGADKGRAVAAIQERLGITPAQTAVFGDYLNDLSLYDRSELGFAMANAHPSVLAAADYTAPANTEDGVLRSVAALMARIPAGRG
ncbi:HAD family hydrolase [Actinomyces timonensis]|uniref:HAD family hydrolase n=1 Tax=Actinomyces timonensis TaxID=1288391 RepID=A0AAU8N2F8_9ACTO